MTKRDLLKKFEKKKEALEEKLEEYECMIDALNEQKTLIN
jgi:ABC-type Zn uptake system ZnuABC Zn-binding protein ZnuA